MLRSATRANQKLIRRFYTAFAGKDGEAMAACYTPGARFSDPAFGELKGAEVGDMWRMLTSRATDLEVELLDSDATETEGHAHWRATYTFAETGRPVVNDIKARFVFEDGKIAEHDDSFSLGKWARQALGAFGYAISAIPPLGAAVRKKARANLAKYREERGR